jgi:hypothetical protein
MVASNKTRRVVCTIVRVAEEPALNLNREGLVRKPSTLVPWADPYIAGLVRRLQSEVRMERAARAERGERTVDVEMLDNRGAAGVLKHASSAVADLDPPSPMTDEDFEWFDLPRFDFDRDIAE